MKRIAFVFVEVGLFGETTHRHTVVTIVAIQVARRDAAREVEVVAIGAIIDTTRPIVTVCAGIVKGTTIHVASESICARELEILLRL